jgi:hypothetical protein
MQAPETQAMLALLKSIGSAINTSRMMRNVRFLAAHEIRIARSVFEDTIPYDRIYIGDGLGFTGAPFTIPVPGLPGSSRKYLINAGDGYTGMSHFQAEKDTLIHELTHVWQGHHSTWAWTVQGSSVLHQAIQGRDGAYNYDHNNYKDWDSYNPEQQAQIVEDWFHDACKEANGGKIVNGKDWFMGEDDPRYTFIELNIRGHQMMPLRPKVHEDIALSHQLSQRETRPPLTDDLLIRILKPRYNANDVGGYGGRAKLLENVFRGTNSAEAGPLYMRLVLHPPGDKVAMYFQSNLSTATRASLLKILMDRMRAH